MNSVAASQFVNWINSLNGLQAAGVGAFLGYGLGTFVTIVSIVTLACWVLGIIAYWKIFTKAGEKGWKAIIPVYSDYIGYKITWQTSKFWIMFALVVVSSILIALVQNGLIGGAVWQLIFILVSLACSIAALVFEIIRTCKLSKAFGHGAGYAVGLIFLPWIFSLIVGFGSSEYKGIPED